MKTLCNSRTVLLAFMTLVLVSCGSGNYANHGTAADRTGTNGATNGNGKVPRGNSHHLKN